VSALGALIFHNNQHHIDDVVCYVGTSAGAMISMLLALGLTPNECLQFVEREILCKNITNIGVEAVFSLMDTFGLDEGTGYEALLRSVLKSKLNVNDMTFEELFSMTGKDLVTCVTNVTLRKCEFWGRHSHPQMSIVTAVRASMTVPLLFTPVEWNGNFYVDGGLLNNFPLDFVPNDKLDTTLAISVTTPCKFPAGPPIEDTSFFDYIQSIVNTVTESQSQDRRMQTCHTLINLTVGGCQDDSFLCFSLKELRFRIDKNMMRQYVMHGYNVAQSQYSVFLQKAVDC
jgi:predicted acylesterase/phospholipase RssA